MNILCATVSANPHPDPSVDRCFRLGGCLRHTHWQKFSGSISKTPRVQCWTKKEHQSPICHLHQAFSVYHDLLLVHQNIFKNHQLMLYTCDSSSILAVAPGTCYKQIIGVNFANHQALEGGSTKSLSSNIMTKMSVCPGENQTNHRCCGNP